MTDQLPPQKFIVYNYVTSRVEETFNPPDYGDPNAALQQAASNAYTGSVAGATSLSASTVSAPAVANIADPAATLGAAAANSLTLSPDQLTQIQSSLGGLDGVGQLPATLNLMSGHAKNVLDNTTRVLDAVDTQFNPQDAGTPGRCVSLGDFIGSIQGKFNEGLTSITSGLSSVANALIAIPRAIITGFAGIATALAAAITGGATALINGLTEKLGAISNQLFGGLGSSIQGVINDISSKVTEIKDAITAEINNVADVINKMLNNAFRLVVPRESVCISSILQKSNENFNPIKVPADLIPDQIIL